MNNIIVEFKNVYFKYEEEQDWVLNNLSFDIYEGEYICVLGHNGSGKSTVSKLISRLESEDEGNIKLFGDEINSINYKRIIQKIGVIFQNPDNQFIGTTVEEDIAFALENIGMERMEMRERVIAAAVKTDVFQKLKFQPHELSGGQKQRVAIAGVIAAKNDLLIFDESTSMLDPKGKREIKELIKDLSKKSGKTVISITHDMDEIVQADRVIVLNKGKKVYDGKPEFVFGNHIALKNMGLDSPIAQKLSLLIDNDDIKPSIYLRKVVKSICEKINSNSQKKHK